MKVNGMTITNMVLVKCLMSKKETKMESTTASGNMERDTEKVFSLIRMVILTLVGGDTVRRKVLEPINSNQLVCTCSVNGLPAKSQKENGFIQMECSTRENSKITNLAALDNGISKMETILMVRINKARKNSQKKNLLPMLKPKKKELQRILQHNTP